MSDLVKVITPPGELYYVQISGQGKLNYNEDGYNYVATINLKGERAESLIKTIKVVLGETQKNETVKSLGYRQLMEDDNGVYMPTTSTTDRDKGAKPTGIYSFQFSTQVEFKDGKKKKISVYDSSKPKPKLVKLGERKIGNGTIGCISGNLQRYSRGPSNKKDCGVSLYLNAIQIIDFKEYVDDGGFDSHEEGSFTGFEPENEFSEAAKANEQAEAEEEKTSKPTL